MSMRYSWWAETARKMVQRGELGTISHMLVRFNQPGIQRYIDEGNSWMLTKAEAGGGALLNLGFHGFDLCRYITGEEPKVVSAVTSHSIWKRDVEDYAFVTLRTPSGMVFLNEASYTFPTNGSDIEHKLPLRRRWSGLRPRAATVSRSSDRAATRRFKRRRDTSAVGLEWWPIVSTGSAVASHRPRPSVTARAPFH